jgi:PAS domain S-box-containing protein
VGKNWFDTCVPVENRENIRRLFESLMEDDSVSLVTHEDEVATQNGERKTILWHNSILKDKAGKAIGLFSSGENITKKKQSEQALAEIAKRFVAIIEGTHVGTWEWNVQTGETIFNSIWAEMIGYTLDELAPVSIRTWEKFTHPEDLKKSEEILNLHFSGKAPFYEFECRMRHKDGHWVWVLDKGKVITWDAEGKPLMMFGTHTDIMERKRTEHDLREREERFRAMFHKNNAVMLLIDPDTGSIVDANGSAEEFYGYTEEQLLRMTIRQINLLSADEIRQQMELALAEKCNYFTFTHRLSNGDTREVEVYSTPIEVSHKTLLYSIIHDITKQKSAEKRITSLLEEKELLLKEVHHRIKNNMNTIGSLLSLQADRISGTAAVMALNDAGNRIQSMSLLYDKLYRSLNYKEMSIKEYLPSLVDEVVAHFPNSRMVDVEMDVQDFVLDVKSLQTIGIIFNELITNIMKYAFAGRDRGRIGVSAVKADDRVTLVIQDDGIGIPESVTIETTTGFGLQLVHGLAQQLNGLIRIERDQGTKVVLEFPT